jgi:adenosine 3'-phospho 5'-phosphosulfate transporter B2
MNRLLALFISIVIVLWRQKNNEYTKNVPFYYYAPSSLSNSISSWAQYEALKFISFPTQVLSKSCKIIPVMIVGIFVNRKSYPVIEYIEAMLITSGVSIFTLSENGSHDEDRNNTMWGIALLLLYLTCDSFTSQWQSRVYKTFAVDQYQMMLGVNIWSMLMTGSLQFSYIHTLP